MAVIDSYSETNQDVVFNIVGTADGVGQSFTGNGNTLSSAKLYLKQASADTVTMNAKIFAHTGTYGSTSAPTGAALATSDNVNCSVLTSSLALVSFTFSGANQIVLAAGTNYVLRLDAATAPTFNIDVGADSTSPTHSGNSVQGTTSFSGYDACFYVESAPTATATLVDNFKSTSLDTTKWTKFEAGSATLTQTNGIIKVAYPASSTSSTDGDITSASTYNLTSSYLYMHVLAVPSSGTSANAEMRIYTNSSNWFRWVYEAGTVYAQRRVAASTTSVASFSYNAALHSWWKIQESGGVITWYTSSNGVTWDSKATYSHSMTITAMTVLLAGTCFQNETNPGTFYFDDFNSPPMMTAWLTA